MIHQIKKTRDKSREELIREVESLRTEVLDLKSNDHISQLIANNVSDNIAITSFDLKAKYLYVSPSVYQSLGYKPEELVGNSFWDFVHPDDKPELFDLLKRYIYYIFNKIFRISDSSLNETLNYRFKAKNGEWQYLQSSINFVGSKLLAVTRNYTEQKLLEEKVLNKSKRYQSLFTLSPIPLWEEDFTKIITFFNSLKEQGINNPKKYFDNHPNEVLNCVNKIDIIDVNQATLDLHEAKNKNELIKKFNQIFTGKSLEAFKKELINIFNNESFFEIESEVSTFKGKIKQVMLKMQLSYEADGQVIGRLATIDITKKKEDEQQIRTLSKLVKQSSTIIAIINLVGEFEYVNDKFINTTGYKLNDLIGKTPRILKSNMHNHNFYENLWATLKHGETWEGEFYNKKENGDLYYEKAIIYPLINEHNEIISYIKEAEDITDRKAAEKALQLKTIELKLRNNELDAFSHSVAHDLKNPISTIIGFSKELNENSNSFSDEEKRKIYQALERSSTKANQIINSLLLFSQVKDIEVKRVGIDFLAIIKEVLNRLEQNISNSKALITYPKEWPTPYGQASWIEEVMVNFVSNSIKYCKNTPQIEIGYDTVLNNTNCKMLKVWVKDNGIGIYKEDQEIIFGKFEQLKQVRTEGHGLGLSIVKRIIEKLGGEVGVTSEAGKGSVFHFTLPMHCPEAKLT